MTPNVVTSFGPSGTMYIQHIDYVNAPTAAETFEHRSNGYAEMAMTLALNGNTSAAVCAELAEVLWFHGQLIRVLESTVTLTPIEHYLHTADVASPLSDGGR